MSSWSVASAESTPVIPKISLANLTGLNGSGLQKSERGKLLGAAEKLGFFYLRDHGMSPRLVRAAFAESRNFFDLPEDVKMRHTAAHAQVVPAPSRCYIPPQTETLDGKGFDIKEVLDMGFERPRSSLPFHGPNNFPGPEHLPNFWNVMSEVQSESMRVYKSVVSSFSALLFGDEGYMNRQFNQDPVFSHRIICYPGGKSAKCGAHSDLGFMTLLFREPGDRSLQIQPRGQTEWIAAPQMEDYITVNIADTLQILTGNRLMSTPHRVMHDQPHKRYAMAMFCYPSLDAQITRKRTAKDIMMTKWKEVWEDQTGAGRAATAKL